MTVVRFVQRALQLIIDFSDSLRDMGDSSLTLSASAEPPAPQRSLDAVQRAVIAASMALADPDSANDAQVGLLTHALDAIRDTLDYERRADHRLSWTLLSLLTATVRGVMADRLMTDPRGFRAINDEDYAMWVLRHGGHPEVLEFPVLRAMYNMVFGYEKGHLERPTVAAGVGMLLVGLMFFTYKGAIFWKMTAGMGDIVIAPMYEVLRRRGVEFEFFHRVDALHLDPRRQHVDAITIGRQASLADGVEHYDPLIRRCAVFRSFPDLPPAEQIQGSATDSRAWNHISASRDDVETRVLRRGVDFDRVVLAVSLGMVEVVAEELIADRPEWREMTTNVRTIGSPGSPDSGFGPTMRPWAWPRRRITTSGYIPPIDTFSSMPQTLWAEDWPAEDRPANGRLLLRCAGRAMAAARGSGRLRPTLPATRRDEALNFLDTSRRRAPSRRGHR